jgi:hypothetical protein
MSSKPKVPKRTVALLLAKKSTPQIIADAKSYVQKMTGNTNFPTPSPSLATVSTQIATLEASYSVSLTKAKGAAAQMHSDLKTLSSTLKNLAAYVENTANADPDNAEAIINSAGMTVKKHTPLPPKVFSVKQGATSGVVEVNSKAVSRASYIYQYTTDQTNANSWVDGYKNAKVKGFITGLTPGIRYYFRVATISTTGESSWSNVISMLVS